MEFLTGLQEYLQDTYDRFELDKLHMTGEWRVFHLHGQRIFPARLLENETYQVSLDVQGQGQLSVHKTEIKFLHSVQEATEISEKIKINHYVRALGLQAIYSTKGRNFVKNKSLYPLMLDREVLFFTLLEGEVLRGVIQGFNRYEIQLSLKSGLQVTVLRHAIYDLRNKKGRSFLKSVQEKRKDWKSSTFYVRDQSA